MKTRLASLAVALAVTTTGCVDNGGSVQIFQTCSFPQTDCTFSSECDAQYIGDTILDIGKQDRLVLAVQVNNQRTPTTPVDTAAAYVQESVTEYSAPAGVAVPGASALVSSLVVPSNGHAVIIVEPITSAVGAALLPQVPASTPTAPQYVDVVAHTRLKGKYADQSTFETAAFDFAIHVCSGCLQPLGCTDPTQTLSICPPGAVGQRPVGVTCQ